MLAHHAVVHRTIPIAFDPNDTIVAHEDLHRAADGATLADRFDLSQVLVVHLIGTGSVDHRAGRTDLDAASAFDAGAFAKWDIRISDHHALRAALGNR